MKLVVVFHGDRLLQRLSGISFVSISANTFGSNLFPYRFFSCRHAAAVPMREVALELFGDGVSPMITEVPIYFPGILGYVEIDGCAHCRAPYLDFYPRFGEPRWRRRRQRLSCCTNAGGLMCRDCSRAQVPPWRISIAPLKYNDEKARGDPIAAPRPAR